MTLALYTFADEAFVPAVVGLINSARYHGFRGVIHVGSPESLSIASKLCDGVVFHVLGRSCYWPTNRKAELLLAHPSERFVYLDADMIVSERTFLERIDEWLTIAPVFAVEALVTSVDYRRHMWAKRLGRTSRPESWPTYYFNAGLFGGIFQRDQPLLAAWDVAIRSVLIPPGGFLSDVDFPYSDQDVLNAVLQDWEPQPVGIGPPDIWAAASQSNPFLHVGTFKGPAVLHCSGQGKPWKLTQVPERWPNAYDLAWYEHVVRQPTPVHTKIAYPPSIRAWFEQRRLARIALRVRRVTHGMFGN